MPMSEDRHSTEREVSKSIGSRGAHTHSATQHGATLSTHFTDVYTDLLKMIHVLSDILQPAHPLITKSEL